MRESSLAKIGRHAVELPPTDTHFVSVRRVDANGRLICGVANNVTAARINVHLITRVGTELRDQSGRRGYGREQRRWIIVFFKRFLRKRLGRGRLTRTYGDYTEKNKKRAWDRPWHRFKTIPPSVSKRDPENHSRPAGSACGFLRSSSFRCGVARQTCSHNCHGNVTIVLR